jgi:hypothetical protein
MNRFEDNQGKGLQSLLRLISPLRSHSLVKPLQDKFEAVEENEELEAGD